ncbi:hypothetical protein VPH35_140120 [Triticum aestivum]
MSSTVYPRGCGSERDRMGPAGPDAHAENPPIFFPATGSHDNCITIINPADDLEDYTERIFLRLPATEDLARTSAACVTFRHLVTDGSFLHRFRRLHPLPVLGYLNLGGFHPAQPPHPSAPTARLLTLDIRDGRVLLFGKQNMMAEGPSISMFPELMVCDPLHRRYILLPPVPEDLVASVESQDDEFLGWSCEPSLIPLSDEEAALAEETSFRVIWSACFKTNMVVFVFSSSTGQWRHLVGDCVYWVLPMNKTDLLVLDTRTMGFSIADLPPGEWSQQDIAIVDAGEGRLGMFCTGHENASGESYLCYTIWQNKGESSGEWQMEKMSLGSGYRYHIEVLFVKNPPITEFCKLDVKTMQVERMCAESRGFSGSKAFIYTNFPPSLLPLPTV